MYICDNWLSFFDKMLFYSKDCYKYDMMDFFFMINKERFLVFVYEKKNNLKIKILFFGI